MAPPHVTGLLDRHHIVHVDYPNDLLRETNEQLWLPAPANCEQRYEPLPLIPNPAVEAHAYRNSEDETAFFSLTAAVGIVGHLPAAEPLRQRNFEALVMDLAQGTLYRGRTWLNVITYSPEDGSRWVRIERTTTYLSRTQEQEQVVRYDFSFDIVRDRGPCGPLWLNDILDLVHGRGDRAVLHVQHILKSQGISEPQATWLPRRTPGYEQALVAVNRGNIIRMAADERVCTICLDSAEGKLIVLSCSPKHIFHLPCLRDWCKIQEGPDHCRCPSCRTPIFTGASLVEWLTYGVKEKCFVPDAIFSKWENFERSCADLDKELAENSQSLVTCSAELMSEILQSVTFRKSPIFEVSFSDPFPSAIDYTRYPEYNICKKAILQVARNLNGCTMSAKVFCNAMMTGIQRDLMARLIENGAQDIMSVEHLAACAAGDEETIRWHTMLPGFCAHIQRLLNRITRLLMLRMCRCPLSMEQLMEGDVHFHGSRSRGYYNPETLGLPRHARQVDQK